MIFFVGAVLSILGPTIILVLAGLAGMRPSAMTPGQTVTFLLLMVLPAVGGVVFGALTNRSAMLSPSGRSRHASGPGSTDQATPGAGDPESA
jgi:hypothetical protein